MINEALIKFYEDFFANEKLNKSYFEDTITSDLKLHGDYRVKPSFGVGNKSFVPWIAIYNRKEVKTIKEGYYLVYLFSADGSGVYLSLSQGTTNFKAMIRRIQMHGFKESWNTSIKYINDYWRNTNVFLKFDSDLECIDLSLPKGRSISTPKAYESANIYGIYYSIEDIKNGKITSDILIHDFNRYLDAYIRMLTIINHVSHTHWNEHFCLHVSDFIESKDIVKKNSKNKIKGIHQTNPPRQIHNSSSQPHSSRKPDWNLIQRYKNDLGEKGEIAVLEYIKQMKKELNKDFRDEMVRHVSKLDGDSLGYDILEINDDGSECYIEVKTTKKGIDTPFFISANELQVSKEYSEKYVLYRVYDFVDDQNFQFYTLRGFVGNNFNLEPMNYLCYKNE